MVNSDEKAKQYQDKPDLRKIVVKPKGESLTIQAGNCSYADILKKMKTSIKPEEIGVGIKKIHKTKDGNVHIELGKGDGHAKKLEYAIKTSLGEDITVQTQKEKFLLDIRDLEETTEDNEIISSIMETSCESNSEGIKVRNIRNFYGGTKQALVEVPGHIAEKVLKLSKIKVGLVICRVRRKIYPKRCFRCLQEGHVARFCKGKDRSQMCRRCGINGHKSNTCTSLPRCVICLEAGKSDINHYMGTSITCRYAT